MCVFSNKLDAFVQQKKCNVWGDINQGKIAHVSVLARAAAFKEDVHSLR